LDIVSYIQKEGVMKYKLIVEYDSDARKVTVTDPDGVIEGTGVLILIGNEPPNLCYNSTMGDMRAVAESFACLSGDEHPRSRRVIAHIKERMRQNHITADEALKIFEKDCNCEGKCHCHLRLVN
jgi:hypothetical protein